MSGTTVSENNKGTSGCSNFIFIPPPKGTNLAQKINGLVSPIS